MIYRVHAIGFHGRRDWAQLQIQHVQWKFIAKVAIIFKIMF